VAATRSACTVSDESVARLKVLDCVPLTPSCWAVAAATVVVASAMDGLEYRTDVGARM